MRDARFRRKILIEAQQMVQELDEIEDQLERYREFDAPAFEVWQKQLFDGELRRKAQLEDDYVKAVEFHNSVVALAKMKRLSMARAFERRREEDAAFLRGSSLERARLTERWRRRERFVRAQLGVASEAPPIEDTTPDLAQTRIKELDFGAAEQLKVLYRKLVRRLHPDRFASDPEADASERRWQKNLWNLAQSAREAKNLRGLEQIYRVVLVRTLDFSELSLTDTHDVYAWLRVELENLRRQRSELAQTPAWDFSRRSDLRPLAARVARRLSEEVEVLESQLHELTGQRAYLEVLSTTRPRRRRRGFSSEAQLALF